MLINNSSSVRYEKHIENFCETFSTFEFWPGYKYKNQSQLLWFDSFLHNFGQIKKFRKMEK